MVYFISTGQHVKIGYTASRNPEGRLKSLQTGSPLKLHLLLFVDGTMKIEAMLHRRFAHLHSHGEWFHLRGELLRYIEDAGASTDTQPSDTSIDEARREANLFKTKHGIDPDMPNDVKAWRIERGLTQRQAALRLGVGRRTVQRAEAKGRPSRAKKESRPVRAWRSLCVAVSYDLYISDRATSATIKRYWPDVKDLLRPDNKQRPQWFPADA